MKKIDFSIVLPVFNEEENIPLVIDAYKKISQSSNVELIFVEDGGSSDNTRKIMSQSAKKYNFVKKLFIKEKGYGISIYEGLKLAKGEFVGWTHADLQTDPKDTLKAFRLILQQKNPKQSYVKGERYGRPFFDVFFTFGMSLFETLVLKKRLFDINAQPNLFHKSFLKIMNNPPKDFSFDLYTYYLANFNNYSVKRFPVFFGDRIHGSSKWNFGLGSRVKLIKRTINFTFELKKYLKNG